MTVRHFPNLRDLSGDELRGVLTRAGELKNKMQHQGVLHETLKNRVLAMIFEKDASEITTVKASTRSVPDPDSPSRSRDSATSSFWAG